MSYKIGFSVKYTGEENKLTKTLLLTDHVGFLPLGAVTPIGFPFQNQGIAQTFSQQSEQFPSNHKEHSVSSHHQLASQLQEADSEDHDWFHHKPEFGPESVNLSKTHESSQSQYSHVESSSSSFSEHSETSNGHTEYSETSAGSKSNSTSSSDGQTKHVEATAVAQTTQSRTADGHTENTKSSKAAKAAQITNINSDGTAETITSAAAQAATTLTSDGKTKHSEAQVAAVVDST